MMVVGKAGFLCYLEMSPHYLKLESLVLLWLSLEGKAVVLMVESLLAKVPEAGLHPEEVVGPVHRMDDYLRAVHQFHTLQRKDLVPDFSVC